MLERVDSYLWSQRPSAVGPQIVAVQNMEQPPDQDMVIDFDNIMLITLYIQHDIQGQNFI